MIKKALMTLALTFALSSSAFCGVLECPSIISKQLDLLRYEIEKMQLDQEQDGEKANMRKKLIGANLEYLESRLTHKLFKAKDQLDKIKKTLDDAVDEDEIEKVKKKIKKAEKKLRDLEESSLAIELVKAQFKTE